MVILRKTFSQPSFRPSLTTHSSTTKLVVRPIWQEYSPFHCQLLFLKISPPPTMPGLPKELLSVFKLINSIGEGDQLIQCWFRAYLSWIRGVKASQFKRSMIIRWSQAWIRIIWPLIIILLKAHHMHHIINITLIALSLSTFNLKTWVSSQLSKLRE